MTDTPRERLRENVVGVTSILVTGLWMGAMFTGQGWWLAALLVGYVVVVPIVAMLFGDEEDREEWWDGWESDGERETGTAERSERRESDRDDEDPLETLRARYARGELTEEQFERKLERLLETETIEQVEDRRRRGDAGARQRDDPAHGGERGRDSEREYEPEYETER